jgi:hypothetical protein
MDAQSFRHIFKSFSGNMFCPSCGKAYSGNEVEKIQPNNQGIILSIKCSKCNLPIMINILQTNIEEITKSSVPRENHSYSIDIDEVIEFHEIVKKFDGNFRKVFHKYN